ncbi:kelch-like protein 23 [Salmo salar]|uniref:Kelch-like protein 23 n=1 Tax=Salmo salar TaxID=8030 RepID=A0A1S3PLZ6_SALSA|nr:kelch-like protein 23 [Salmo salar]|eukprot:XP_014028708.1 PREDICTED: kelch-like protein 23 [Salmo salar]
MTCGIPQPNELLDGVKKFYIGDIHTDITLQCATGQVFHCHKAVLSAHRSYFKVMFTADMKARSNNLFKLTGIDYELLSALVNYIYTSRVSITETNVQSLLEAADLQLNSVKTACKDFLIRILDVDNCPGMHSFAVLHICPEWEARRVMLIQQQEEFLEVDYDKLSSVNVWNDEVLLDAVVKWLTHDFLNRVDHIQNLLCCIHLELDEMHFKTALDVQRPCLLGNEGKVRSFIIHALKTNCKETSTSRKKTVKHVCYWRELLASTLKSTYGIQ